MKYKILMYKFKTDTKSKKGIYRAIEREAKMAGLMKTASVILLSAVLLCGCGKTNKKIDDSALTGSAELKAKLLSKIEKMFEKVRSMFSS